MSLYEEAWGKLKARMRATYEHYSGRMVIRAMKECLGEAQKEVDEARNDLVARLKRHEGGGWHRK